MIFIAIKSIIAIFQNQLYDTFHIYSGHYLMSYYLFYK
jgi:hypothetical protein